MIDYSYLTKEIPASIVICTDAGINKENPRGQLHQPSWDSLVAIELL